MKKARLNNEKILIKFNGNDADKIRKSLLEFPKEDVRFLTSSASWELSFKDEYCEFLRSKNFDLDTNLFNRWNNNIVDEGWKDINIPEEYNYLFDYQQDTMRFSIYHGMRALLALDMGAGKSVTALSLMDYADSFPTIIISPSIVKVHWKREYFKFINKGDTIKIVESSKEMIDYRGQYDIIIINYELLARNINIVEQDKGEDLYIPSDTLIEFYNNNFGFAIIDEIHKIKTMETKTKNAVDFLTKDTKNILGLTGTPVLSGSKDIFPIVNLLVASLFKSFYSFVNRYANVKIHKGTRNYFGARNSAELNSILINNVMFRLTKDQIGRTGEKPLTSVIPIKLKNPQAYQKMLEELDEADDKESGFAIVDKMRKEAWKQKKDGFFEKLDDMLEESSEKLVIFAHNKIVIEEILKRYKDIAVKIDGSVSTRGEIRQNIIDKFVKSKTLRLFIGGISATAEGMDGLQYGCSIAIYVQWPWTFGKLEQATSRVDRTGQKNRVNVYHFPAEDTIEEIFMGILDRKAKMSREIVDGDEMLDEDLLEELLRITKRKIKRSKILGKIS